MQRDKKIQTSACYMYMLFTGFKWWNRKVIRIIQDWKLQHAHYNEINFLIILSEINDQKECKVNEWVKLQSWDTSNKYNFKSFPFYMYNNVVVVYLKFDSKIHNSMWKRVCVPTLVYIELLSQIIYTQWKVNNVFLSIRVQFCSSSKHG